MAVFVRNAKTDEAKLLCANTHHVLARFLVLNQHPAVGTRPNGGTSFQTNDLFELCLLQNLQSWIFALARRVPTGSGAECLPVAEAVPTKLVPGTLTARQAHHTSIFRVYPHAEYRTLRTFLDPGGLPHVVL